MIKLGNPVILLGDFNAKTKCLPDCIGIENDVDIPCTIDTNIADFFNDIFKLESYNVSFDRISQDTGKINSHGAKLPNLCKSHTLCIATGRMGKDKLIGKLTYKAVLLITLLAVIIS